MSKVVIDESSLTSVADAIRAKGGTSANLSFPDGMVSAINNFELAPKRISTTAEAYSISSNLTITGVDMTNVQCIHVCLADVPTDLTSSGYATIALATVILSDTKNTISSFSMYSIEGVDEGRSWYSTSEYTGELTITFVSNSLTLKMGSEPYSDYTSRFYGHYICEIIGQ